MEQHIPPNSWAAFPGQPGFKPLEGKNVITTLAWPLLAWSDDWLVSWGTVTVIRPGLAVTATHVIESLIRHWGLTLHTLTDKAPFQLVMIQDDPDGQNGFIWRAHRVVACAASDTSVLVLSPYSANWASAPKIGPRMTLHPPPLESRVTAFGYPQTATAIERNGSEVVLSHHVNGHTAFGSVEEVHIQRRDNAFLPFPCFRTSAQFDPGMSGGPVFDENGHLCGLICAGTAGDRFLNYASLLWTVAHSPIDVSDEGASPDLRTLCEMAADGLISMDGCDHVVQFDNGIIGWRSAT